MKKLRRAIRHLLSWIICGILFPGMLMDAIFLSRDWRGNWEVMLALHKEIAGP